VLKQELCKNRALSLEDSKLKLTKAKLELSNYLWLENNIPLELALEDLIPESQLEFYHSRKFKNK
jgi:hypothetical protein